MKNLHEFLQFLLISKSKLILELCYDQFRGRIHSEMTSYFALNINVQVFETYLFQITLFAPKIILNCTFCVIQVWRHRFLKEEGTIILSFVPRVTHEP